MLTKAVEHGIVKSLQYFPLQKPIHPDVPPPSFSSHGYLDTDSGDNFEAMLELISVADSSNSGILLRCMDLRVRQGAPSSTLIADSNKHIRHYQLEGWVDHMVPQEVNRDRLVELCKISRKDEIEYDGAPRIVHCGAGSGRTGAFIALDFLLGELENGTIADCDETQDPIFDTVDSLRKQRMLMVQTIDLYRFLYHTLRHELTKKLEIEADAMAESRLAYPFFPRTVSIRYHRTKKEPYKFIITSSILTGDSPFIVECTYVRGQQYKLLRTYREFFELQRMSSLHYGLDGYGMDQFTGLLYPDTLRGGFTLSEQDMFALSKQCNRLEKFVKQLLAFRPYQDTQLSEINSFFTPRKGDVEVTETIPSGTAAEASNDVWPGLDDRSKRDHAQSLEKHTTSASESQESPEDDKNVWRTAETYEKAQPTMQLDGSQSHLYEVW